VAAATVAQGLCAAANPDTAASHVTPASAAASAHAKWVQPKTPWGDPDLQGTWPISDLMTVPLERPVSYGTRSQFTAEELAQQRKAADAQNQRYKDEEAKHQLGIGHWVEDTSFPVQTSLIIDPPNGRLPEQTPLGKELSSKMGSDWNRQVFDSVADFGTWNRCITRGLPEGMFPNPYNNGIQIVQSPGYVVINLEMIHEARIVPLGKMPALASEVKQWMGSSRGHWEGSTLVIETTNFNGLTSMTDVPTRGSPNDPRSSSTQMRIVERLHRTADDRMTYTVTIDDPVTQTAPWTAQLPWKRDDSYRIYEYACHEDNEAVRNYIVTSRYRRAHEPPKGAPDAGKPDAGKPDAGKPDASKPDVNTK
jgi:hypothetical protein